LLGLSLLLLGCGDNTATPAVSPGVVVVNNTPIAPLSLNSCAAIAASATPAGQSSNPATASGGTRVEVPAGFRLFTSNTFPYAVAIPENWQIREGQTQGNLKADLLIGEKTDNTVAAVTIISEKLTDPNQDSNSYFQAKLKELGPGQNFVYEKQPDRSIGGVTTAYTISYNSPSGQTFRYPTQALQVTFTAVGRGWVVSYTATPAQANQYCGAFSKMLDSWQFTGLVK
jgi:hypothetical protein